MMSLAMSRGRSRLFLIAVSSSFAFDDNCRLATVGVGDPRTCKVQHRNDGLRCVGADLGQNGIEAIAAAAELPEWIVDSGRPVHAGDDLAARCATSCGQAVPVDAKCEFDDAREAVRLATAAVI